MLSFTEYEQDYPKLRPSQFKSGQVTVRHDQYVYCPPFSTQYDHTVFSQMSHDDKMCVRCNDNKHGRQLHLWICATTDELCVRPRGFSHTRIGVAAGPVAQRLVAGLQVGYPPPQVLHSDPQLLRLYCGPAVVTLLVGQSPLEINQLG